MKFKFQWDLRGHWDVARSGNTTVLHLVSFCRRTSPDGIVLYRATLGPLGIAFGRRNQPPKP